MVHVGLQHEGGREAGQAPGAHHLLNAGQVVDESHAVALRLPIRIHRLGQQRRLDAQLLQLDQRLFRQHACPPAHPPHTPLQLPPSPRPGRTALQRLFLGFRVLKLLFLPRVHLESSTCVSPPSTSLTPRGFRTRAPGALTPQLGGGGAVTRRVTMVKCEVCVG